MANRSIQAKWLRSKRIKKRTAPKAFGQKALSGVNSRSRSGSTRELADHAVFQNAARGGGRAEYMVQRLQHYIKTRRPHHRILYWIFSPAIRHASEELFREEVYTPPYEGRKTYTETASGYIVEREREIEQPKTVDQHPKIAAELLQDLYAQQDESLRVFQFEAVVLEKSDIHFKIMYFRAQECFIVFRKNREVKVSVKYTDPMYLKRLALKKIEWAGEPYELDNESLAELDC